MEALNGLFKELRKAGLVARQNFMCCGGCASAELASVLEAKPAKRGYAFFHRQQGERLAKGDRRCYIHYSAREGGDDLQVAMDIVAAAGRVDLAVKWDGKLSSCVEVLLPEEGR